MGRLFSRNFSRYVARYSHRRHRLIKIPPVTVRHWYQKQKARVCTTAFFFSSAESTALLPVFDTGNREKPRWKHQFPMTQLVCHEDRTPNQATLFLRSIEIVQARTMAIYKIQVSLAIKKNKWKKMTYRDWHDHFRRRSSRNPICRSRQRYDDDEGETSVTPNCESEANIYNRSKSLARFQQRFFGDKRSSGCGDFILSFAAGPSFVTYLKDIDTRSILSHCCREHITLRFMASFLLPLRNRKLITACSITSAHRTRQFMNAHFRWKIGCNLSKFIFCCYKHGIQPET